MRIVLERRGAEEQHVPPERSDRRDSSIAGLPGMPGRTPETLRLVYDEQIDSGLRRCGRQVGAIDERLERDNRPAVYVERVEVLTEIACHVRQPRGIEQ